MIEFLKFGEKRSKRELKLINLIRNENYQIKVLSLGNPNTNLHELLKVKNLIQKMIPKMPKDYVLRQVFDPKQCTISVWSSNSKTIISAACFKPFYEFGFVELVFLAVDNSEQIKGFGSLTMNLLKEVIKIHNINYKSSSLDFFENLKINLIIDSDFKLKTFDIPKINDEDTVKKVKMDEILLNENLYIYTYADNSAIGFFKKNLFSSNLVSKRWKGIVKDYEGGTLMECKVFNDTNYLNSCEIIKAIADKIFKKMESINQFHILHQANEIISIEESNEERTFESFLQDFIQYIIYSLESDPSSWPFLEPVNSEIAPGYYDAIPKPMDLSTISKKHINGKYPSINLFIEDVILMLDNCTYFNGPESQYTQCSKNLRKSLSDLLVKYSDTISYWKLSFNMEEYF